MKHHYVLTVHFSTNKSIEAECGAKTYELIGELGNAIRKVLDIFHLEIRSSCLKTDEQSLVEQDADGNYRLRKW